MPPRSPSGSRSPASAFAALDEQIAQLQHARELLAGALWCRFDHPATDCKIMGAEIDRRLDASGIP
jgi:hypothetical protein